MRIRPIGSATAILAHPKETGLYAGKHPVAFGRAEENYIVMENAARQWTPEEQDYLFDVYFGPSPGICPVCVHEVCMVMTNIGRTVTLLLSCDGCNNKARVSRSLPLDGPLQRTEPSRVVTSSGIRTHDPDQSERA